MLALRHLHKVIRLILHLDDIGLRVLAFFLSDIQQGSLEGFKCDAVMGRDELPCELSRHLSSKVINAVQTLEQC